MILWESGLDVRHGQLDCRSGGAHTEVIHRCTPSFGTREEPIDAVDVQPSRFMNFVRFFVNKPIRLAIEVPESPNFVFVITMGFAVVHYLDVRFAKDRI